MAEQKTSQAAASTAAAGSSTSTEGLPAGPSTSTEGLTASPSTSTGGVPPEFNFTTTGGASQSREDYKTMSRPKLEDLLARHQKLANNSGFTEKLKDKGDKLKRTVVEIQTELEKRIRQEKESGTDYLQTAKLVQELEWRLRMAKLNTNTIATQEPTAETPTVPKLVLKKVKASEGNPTHTSSTENDEGHSSQVKGSGNDGEWMSFKSTSSSVSMLKRTKQNLSKEQKPAPGVVVLLDLNELKELHERVHGRGLLVASTSSDLSRDTGVAAAAAAAAETSSPCTQRTKLEAHELADWMRNVKRRYKKQPHVFAQFKALINDANIPNVSDKRNELPPSLYARLDKFSKKHPDIRRDLDKYLGVGSCSCPLHDQTEAPATPSTPEVHLSMPEMPAITTEIAAESVKLEPSPVVQAEPVPSTSRGAMDTVTVTQPPKEDKKINVHKFVPYRDPVDRDEEEYDEDNEVGDEEEEGDCEGGGYLDRITEESESDLDD